MPGKLMMRAISDIHTFWYRMTGGLIGSRFGRAPILLLTTTGRKTGRKRTTPLLYYADGDDMVIIASNNGNPRHPIWYLNLTADPKAQVQVRSEIRNVIAETASPAEKARLWPLVTEMYRQYDDYQRRTSREIPVVILKPG